jgi:hypothetical protein
MSRSDGTFPSYSTIEISAIDPPDGWNDGARKCRACGKNWPRVRHFSPSPCCGVEAGIVTTSRPDMTWDIAAKALLNSRFEKYYERWNEGITDEQIAWVTTEGETFSDADFAQGLEEIERLCSQEA